MTKEREAQLRSFIAENNIPKISFEFIDIALTHKSYANEFKKHRRYSLPLDIHNQRLEFFGDAVLGMIVAEELYRNKTDYDEGKLTKKKAQVVRESTLAAIGNQLGIGRVLLMGKGEVASRGIQKVSNIADAVESLIAAIFLETGYEKTKDFVLKICGPYIKRDEVPQDSIDYKSYLQEYLVKKEKIRPEYKVMNIEGPEHKKTYVIGLYILGKQVSEAKGNSKKKAEQHAAENFFRDHNIRVNY